MIAVPVVLLLLLAATIIACWHWNVNCFGKGNTAARAREDYQTAEDLRNTHAMEDDPMRNGAIIVNPTYAGVGVVEHMENPTYAVGGPGVGAAGVGSDDPESGV